MKYGYEELHGEREKWFDSAEEAKTWASTEDPLWSKGWRGRSGLKTREE